MALDIQMERQQAHALLDQLPPAKLGAVRSLLAVMVDEDEEELTEEDRHALRASDEYFRNGGQGVPFEQVVSDLGFTMEQIRGAKKGTVKRIHFEPEARPSPRHPAAYRHDHPRSHPLLRRNRSGPRQASLR